MKCAYCHDQLDVAATCVECQTAMHFECWEEHPKCPTRGCGVVVHRVTGPRLLTYLSQIVIAFVCSFGMFAKQYIQYDDYWREATTFIDDLKEGFGNDRVTDVQLESVRDSEVLNSRMTWLDFTEDNTDYYGELCKLEPQELERCLYGGPDKSLGRAFGYGLSTREYEGFFERVQWDPVYHDYPELSAEIELPLTLFERRRRIVDIQRSLKSYLPPSEITPRTATSILKGPRRRAVGRGSWTNF